MARPEDLTGRKFNRLTCTERVSIPKGNSQVNAYTCVCDCGKLLVDAPAAKAQVFLRLRDKEAAQEFNIDYDVLWTRMSKDWEVLDALTRPKEGKGRKEKEIRKGAEFITLPDGRQLSYTQAETEFGIPDDTLRRRIQAGWSVEKALTTPVRPKKEEA